MSWSFQAVGKPAAVLAKAKQEFAKSPCVEPEETIRQKALEQIDVALSAFPASAPVKVIANGSQSSEYAAGVTTGKATNSLNVTIEPLYGFVE
jgi:hypothetical protein